MLLVIFFIFIFICFLYLFVPHTIHLLSDIEDNRIEKERRSNSIFSRLDDDTFSTPTAIGMIIGYVLVLLAYIGFATWFIIDINKPYEQTEEMQSQRINIEHKLSYYDKFFYDYIEEAKDYNKEVNRGNNKKLRFKTEDRTEYMINTDFYINEFNEKNNK